jgi:hypothetical protein
MKIRSKKAIVISLIGFILLNWVHVSHAQKKSFTYEQVYGRAKSALMEKVPDMIDLLREDILYPGRHALQTIEVLLSGLETISTIFPELMDQFVN